MARGYAKGGGSMTKRYDARSLFFRGAENRGSMLMELLLSVAIAAIVIPFVFRYQQNAAMRAQNIAVARRMEIVQNALERYITQNREQILGTVGKSITRVHLADLADYGVPFEILSHADEYQLRILKSADTAAQATLQGVVVLTDSDITPVRTREIVAIGGNTMGFIEGRRAYGTFGAWRADAIDLGVGNTDGIVASTGVMRDNALYLSRVPTDNADDATMRTALNLGGHDIENTGFFDAMAANFGETIYSGAIAAKNVVFQNRTTVDKLFETKNATVAGVLSADSRTMEIAGGMSLDDVAKFSNFKTDDFWVGNLTLSGLSVSGDDDAVATLKINRALDMTGGRISALYATIGYTGSVAPRLVVTNRVEDSVKPEFFWDADMRAAHFFDVSFKNLNIMAARVIAREGVAGTDARRLFSAVAGNKNATAADFMNAIVEIQARVRAKYRLLNLE